MIAAFDGIRRRAKPVASNLRHSTISPFIVERSLPRRFSIKKAARYDDLPEKSQVKGCPLMFKANSLTLLSSGLRTLIFTSA